MKKWILLTWFITLVSMLLIWPIRSMLLVRSLQSKSNSSSSKGEKVEVYWNWQAFEDLAMLSVGFAPIMENVDYHWEIFLWGDPPIHPLVDFDLVDSISNRVYLILGLNMNANGGKR